MRRNTIGTLLYTWLRGEEVGVDEFGNRYYRERRGRLPYGLSAGEKRWVVFAGEAEASRVPARWHAWLHHTIEAPPTEGGVPEKKPWEKPHQPNLTMTPEAYRPPGHTLRGGRRDRGTGDYEPWTPSS
jgi:NADH:ubiquinone oxidoreductase subunit